jgi:type VI secretion system protein ImpJ
MIVSASGCMPDGTVFSIPEQDNLPAPFQPVDFSKPGSQEIYLALPVLSDITCEISGRQSAGQGTERYSLTRVDARDLHSDEGDVQQIDVASLMPRIVSGAEDLSAMVTLPLCRIRNTQATGALVLDDSFIPTCQAIRVSSVLSGFAGDVQGLIRSRACELAKRIGSLSRAVLPTWQSL